MNHLNLTPEWKELAARVLREVARLHSFPHPDRQRYIHQLDVTNAADDLEGLACKCPATDLISSLSRTYLKENCPGVVEAWRNR